MKWHSLAQALVPWLPTEKRKMKKEEDGAGDWLLLYPPVVQPNTSHSCWEELSG